MNRLTRGLLIMAAVAMVALAGCSNQDPVAPANPAPDMTADQQALNDAMTRLLDMVETTSSSPADDPNHWAAVEAAMAEYGVAILPVDKSRTAPLPTPLHMVTFAVAAVNAVNEGDWWYVLTSFRDYPTGGNAGFSMCWLDPLDGYGPGYYLCNVYVDRPMPWPDGTVEVKPYSSPIVDAAMRQYQALAKPDDLIVENGFQADDIMMFNYWYHYRSEIGERMGQMMQFRLAIIEP